MQVMALRRTLMSSSESKRVSAGILSRPAKRYSPHTAARRTEAASSAKARSTTLSPSFISSVVNALMHSLRTIADGSSAIWATRILADNSLSIPPIALAASIRTDISTLARPERTDVKSILSEAFLKSAACTSSAITSNGSVTSTLGIGSGSISSASISATDSRIGSGSGSSTFSTSASIGSSIPAFICLLDLAASVSIEDSLFTSIGTTAISVWSSLDDSDSVWPGATSTSGSSSRVFPDPRPKAAISDSNEAICASIESARNLSSPASLHASVNLKTRDSFSAFRSRSCLLS